MIVADTDAFIDLLRGEGAHRMLATLLKGARLATTAITVFEIWRGLTSETARDVPSGVFVSTR